MSYEIFEADPALGGKVTHLLRADGAFVPVDPLNKDYQRFVSEVHQTMSARDRKSLRQHRDSPEFQKLMKRKFPVRKMEESE